MKIEKMSYTELKKFLKFAITKEDGSFKVLPRAGIIFYDIKTNQKIADLWIDTNEDIRIEITSEFDSPKRLSKIKKLRMVKNIYFKIRKEYDISKLPAIKK